MAREFDDLRNIYAILLERFQKPNINAKEYAAYLGKTEEKVRDCIRSHELPGKVLKGKHKDEFVIPVMSIARFEIQTSNTDK